MSYDSAGLLASRLAISRAQVFPCKLMLLFCGAIRIFVFGLMLVVLLLDKTRGEDILSLENVKNAWLGIKAPIYLSTTGERIDTRTFTNDGGQKVQKLWYSTGMSGKKLVVIFEHLREDGEFDSAAFGVNEKYAFKLSRSRPDGRWQLRLIDIGGQQLVDEVRQRYGYVYYGVDESEWFLGFESLIELARMYPDRLGMKRIDGQSNRFAFHFRGGGEDPPLSRMGVPIPALHGIVDVNARHPYLPVRVEWSSDGDPATKYVREFTADGRYGLVVCERGEDGDGWVLESNDSVKRFRNAPSDAVFYLSGYGIPEPVIDVRRSVNWTAILLVSGGVLFAVFVFAKRFSAR